MRKRRLRRWWCPATRSIRPESLNGLSRAPRRPSLTLPAPGRLECGSWRTGGANFIKIDALLEVFKRLEEKVDVIVENFRPDVKTKVAINNLAALLSPGGCASSAHGPSTI